MAVHASDVEPDEEPDDEDAVPDDDPDDEPVVPEEEPVVPEDEPVVPEDEPVVPEEEPVVPEDEPVDPEDEPVASASDPDDEPELPPPLVLLEHAPPMATADELIPRTTMTLKSFFVVFKASPGEEGYHPFLLRQRSDQATCLS